MRLIDADLLMQNYDLKSATKYGNKNAKQQEHSYSTLMMYEVADMIDDAPTAYDVEDVVKQIEEIKDSFHGGTLQEYYYKGALEMAIDIVKRGGVSNE